MNHTRKHVPVDFFDFPVIIRREHLRRVSGQISLQGFLAHKKTPTPLWPPLRPSA
jgi:hypothetical protein